MTSRIDLNNPGIVDYAQHYGETATAEFYATQTKSAKLTLTAQPPASSTPLPPTATNTATNTLPPATSTPEPPTNTPFPTYPPGRIMPTPEPWNSNPTSDQWIIANKQYTALVEDYPIIPQMIGVIAVLSIAINIAKKTSRLK